ncbi:MULTISPECIES: PLDc N-terminal domain-containing protein [unclassified Marinobacter]|uniref:PLDc N-terminal domain-containing protein n=1 Tax=unclassified Marinobacter TaxID=83889 RepID=UPI0026E1840E|nr:MULTISPECIES: PLDc N-terminal domain-containing protein [unclassified Marinobacter]MDO6442904.1 PLDc N-terminal domain-containing protein [Marinobacter sp. 2_MG-2023]MDO6822882.1 PLDc N-terminal domain-containing protein [Marinobacter sp. 1_MG-2023]
MDSLFSSLGNVFGGLLSLIWLIIVIMAIINVTKSSASTLAKVLWIIVLIFFPLVGLIIWYLFGPRG